MLRPVANPPNPFLSAHAEYLEEPPAVQLEVYEEHARSILSENDSPDIPFRYSINPYRGCQHACAYCYARPTHEYLGLGAGTDFDSKISVKVNAPELLAAVLAKKSWSGDSLAFSGVTDCYQPLEAVYSLTRRCLEVCRDFSNPAGIVTKSYLIVRDIDVLTELHRRARVHVIMSIAFADDAVARKIDAGAPPPSRRFDALRRLHEAGLPVGVMVAPIIPGLNDREIPAVLERAAECGARWAGYQALRLAGNVKAVFLERLAQALPDRARRVEQRIRDMRGGRLNNPEFFARMRGEGPYWKAIQELFRKSALRYGFRSGSDEDSRKRRGRSANEGQAAPAAPGNPASALPGGSASAAAGEAASPPHTQTQCGTQTPRGTQVPANEGPDQAVFPFSSRTSPPRTRQLPLFGV